MISIHPNIKEQTSATELLLIQDFEKTLQGIAQRGLTERGLNSLRMLITLSLSEPNAVQPVGKISVRDDSTFAISGSFDMAVLMHQYISQRTDIAAALHDKVLSVNIEFSVKPQSASVSPSGEMLKGEEVRIPFHASNPRYHFDQIILSPDFKEEIVSALQIIEHQDLIYEKWGFKEVDPTPRTILNFHGASGTGKTMCAHAAARYLNKKILALNYAEIESKYVGEAPKNLQCAFDLARTTDCVLFFDEADSFLGKRIQNIQQGADQALNSLRSQMLILLEEHPGVVIFATNLVSNFDSAFESRILKHLKFELPDQKRRAEILRKLLPCKVPTDHPFSDDELFELNASTQGLSGRELKNAVLGMLSSHAQPDMVFTLDMLQEALNKVVKCKDSMMPNALAKAIEKKLTESETEVSED